MASKSGDERGAELLSLPQLARYLGMSVPTLYQWVQQGKVPAFKIGVTWRFRRSDIDAWLESQRFGPPVSTGIPPLTDPVEPLATRWRIRQQEEQAHQALIDACRAFIETTMRTEDRQVFLIEQFVDRFGRDVVDAVVEQLRKEKKVEVDQEKGLSGEMVEVLRRRK